MRCSECAAYLLRTATLAAFTLSGRNRVGVVLQVDRVDHPCAIAEAAKRLGAFHGCLAGASLLDACGCRAVDGGRCRHCGDHGDAGNQRACEKVR